eukprot:m.79662 g.79662  ORF g.79662 m.79662 type:complete len:550 (-) comp12723_c0_seq3:3-1652(-)
MMLPILARRAMRFPRPFATFVFKRPLSSCVIKHKEGFDTGIFVSNSLTKSKVPLLTMKPNILTWYQCGPTVYDSAHLGHGATYVRFDIIRRLMENHFKIRVLMAQNVTDVDDKIIARAAERGTDALTLARKYEKEFQEEMLQLNVLPPHIHLRVTEHIDEIISFIQGIEAQSHLYEGMDGLYFDTQAFGRTHTYGKLQPNRQKHTNGMGYTSHEMAAKQKKHEADFALWKNAKPGELSWSSPWGEGRPGWHIECSAMAGHVFGNKLDLHTGGQDLVFPHHENEIAQSESHFCTQEWCNYFLHSGHVMFKDVKMSKSLKNGMSIKQLLDTHTPSEFRMLCLTTQYNRSFNFDKELLDRAANQLKTLNNFLHMCDELVSKEEGRIKLETQDFEYINNIQNTMEACDKAFRDDFDTPVAMRHINKLIAFWHHYFQPTKQVNIQATKMGADFVRNTMKMLGVKVTEKSLSTGDMNLNASPLIQDEILDALITYRSTVRNAAIENVKQETTKALAKQLLTDCDALREKLSNEPCVFMFYIESNMSMIQIRLRST